MLLFSSSSSSSCMLCIFFRMFSESDDMGGKGRRGCGILCWKSLGKTGDEKLYARLLIRHMKMMSECHRNNTLTLTMHAFARSRRERRDEDIINAWTESTSIYPLYIYHIYVKWRMRHFPSIRLQMSNKTRVYYAYQKATINMRTFQWSNCCCLRL